MKNQFNLDITTPCKENFNKFKTTPNGGFCGSCKEEVIDFTAMSTKEITTYFSTNNTENTCGRFKVNQLNNLEVKPVAKRKYGILSGIGLACLALFSMCAMHAQETESSGNGSAIKDLKFQNNITVKGTVTDGALPLPNVNVMLQGTEIRTTTDFDGNFKFPKKLKNGAVLVFTSFGMDSQKVVIDNKDATFIIDLKINMKTDSIILMGKVASKEIYKSKTSK